MSCSPPSKRARVELTPQIKKDICLFKQSNPKVTQSKIITYAVEKFGMKIGRSTVSDILKDSTKWLAVPSNDRSTSRNRKPKHEDLENDLFLWFTDARSRNMILTDELLKTQAKLLGDRLGVVDFAYSRGWLNRFKQRRGIQNYKAHGESASLPSTEPVTTGLVIDPEETTAESSTSVNKVYGPNMSTTEHLNNTDRLCGESISDESSRGMVSMAENSELSEVGIGDNKGLGLVPKASTVKTYLTEIANFVEHHRGMFSVADLDALDKIHQTVKKITSKAESQKKKIVYHTDSIMRKRKRVNVTHVSK
ncbi:tigger transposable element-derived protein 2-like [Haliotis asinina]|uniref:tigger transposable element-derived protein 2-like n=1 Tax=Haliotis asinina TaxID=109174 RepID=UPI0035320A15